MKIKLLAKASWGGKQRKAGSVHDVDALTAEKLISRGYAEEYTPEEDSKDADQPE